jgi:hypothetical protein
MMMMMKKIKRKKFLRMCGNPKIGSVSVFETLEPNRGQMVKCKVRVSEAFWKTESITATFFICVCLITDSF